MDLSGGLSLKVIQASFIILFVVAAFPVEGLSLKDGIDHMVGEGLTVLVWEVPHPTVEIGSYGSIVTIDRWGTSYSMGMPMLPERSYYLPVGPGEDPFIIETMSLGIENRVLERPVANVPEPTTNRAGPLFHDEEGNEQRSVMDLGILEHGNSRFWVIRLSPFRTDGNALFWPNTVQVKVATGSADVLSETLVPEDLPSPTEIDPNAEGMGPLWSPPSMDAQPIPTAQPSYTDRFPPTECLIITTSTYNSTLRPLAEWKTMRGVPTRIVETGWISSAYTGSDTQEKVRNCIKAFYTNENLKWVVIGGDHSVVPSRMAYIPDGYDDGGSDGNTVPADSYYGDIAGSGHTPYDWDGDNDGNYGEYSVDGIDLNAEVWVGRLSVSSTSNMQTLVNNIINYEKNPTSGSWFNRAVLAGAYSNYKESSTSNDTTDEATLKNTIRSDFLSSSNYNPYTLYEKGGIWPSQFSCNASLTNANMVSAIDPGAFMVNMAGHGSSTGIYRRVWIADSNGNKLCDSGETSDYAYYTTSASQTNGGKKPLFYNDACNNGEFDRTTCLTEDILLDVGIGAVGSARVSWYSKPWAKGSDGGYYNQGHDYRFWQQFFAGNYQPGKALALSKYDYIQDKTAHDLYCWKNLLQYNLMGDPEIPIWTKRPGTLSISHSDPVPSPGSNTFTVTDGSGNPVNGAKVCLMNLTEFYGTAITGSDGKCSITLPQITLRMNLTVTARNFKPLLKTVLVGSDTEKPRIVSVESLGARTTGDNFKINALITDNVEVSSAMIEYNWSVSQPVSTFNTSMVKSGPNNHTFIYKHPTDKITEFWYRIGARDVKGNWNHSIWYHFAVTDNDLPELIKDNSSIYATTGDSFTFEAHLSDNIGVGMATVNYTMNGLPSRNVSLCGPGDVRSALIVVPSDSIGGLSYRFIYNDTSGNLNTTTVRYRTIIDDDAPLLIGDNTVLPPTTGDQFVVNVSVTDNIAILDVRLIYSIGGQTSMNQSMQKGSDGNYTRMITVGPAVDSNITYHIYAKDTSGNVMNTVDNWIDILDNDLPYMIMDTSDLVATTGESFNISLRAGDNIGVGKVSIECSIGGSDWDVILAVYDNAMERWYSNVIIPISAEGNISYRFDLADSAANHFMTERRAVPILDNDRPGFIEDLSSMDANTGEPFQFICIVQENINISSVTISGEMDGFELSLELSFQSIAGDMEFKYGAIWTVPIERIGELTYSFLMTDSSGNENSSGTFSLLVIDTILPYANLTLHTERPGQYTTGETTIMHCYPTDNIKVHSIELQVLFPGNITPELFSMEKVDHGEWTPIPPWVETWGCLLIMPSNRTGTIQFRTVCNDTSMNQEISDWLSTPLIDDDAPLLTILSTTKSMGTGSVGTILFGGSDNIGIIGTNVTVMDGPLIVGSIVTLPNGSISAEVEAASDAVGTGHVQLSVHDGVQWANITLSMDVYDDDVPIVLAVQLLTQYGIDVEIPIEASVSDNVGMDSIVLTVVSEQVLIGTYNLVPTEDKVSYAFMTTVPMELHFEITVKDLSGNTAIDSVSTVVVDDKAPEVELKDPPEKIEVGKKVVLDASGTTDTSGNLNYTWKITTPEGTTFTLYGLRTTFVPDQKGNYKVSLTVTDPAGNKATESFDIVVDEEEPPLDTSLLIYFVAGILLLVLLLLILFFLVRSRKKAHEENGSDEWGEE
jgi:hypothetical protein